MKSLVVFVSFLAFVACDSDPGKRPIGATCDEAAQCASSLCVQNICIDPVGCATAFATGTPEGLVEACMVGLQSVAVAPLEATAPPGGSVQFTATGTFGTGEVVNPTDCVSTADCPSGYDCRPTEDGMRCVLFSADMALTASPIADLTAVVMWQGAEGLVTFPDAAKPGLASISRNAIGTFVIVASINRSAAAPKIVSGTARLTVTSRVEPR